MSRRARRERGNSFRVCCPTEARALDGRLMQTLNHPRARRSAGRIPIWAASALCVSIFNGYSVDQVRLAAAAQRNPVRLRRS